MTTARVNETTSLLSAQQTLPVTASPLTLAAPSLPVDVYEGPAGPAAQPDGGANPKRPWAARHLEPALRATGGIVLAPVKMVVTPSLGAVLGAASGAAAGAATGYCAVIGLYIAIIDPSGIGVSHDDHKGPVQKYCEGAVGIVVAVPVLLVSGVAASLLGAGIGALGGAVSGAASGLAEGYQAAWDNRLPRLGGLSSFGRC